MWVILLNNADWDCFKTLTSQEILMIRNLLRVEHCAFLEVLDCRFTQFNGIRNHLFGHWIEIRKFACSGTMGSNCFCSWKCFSCFRSIGETWEWWSQTPQVPTTKSMWWKTLMWSKDNEAVIKMIIKRKSYNETCFQDSELLLIGCLIELIWTHKSKSSTSTPKTNSQTS